MIDAIYFGTKADILRLCRGMQLAELRLVVRVIRQARLDHLVANSKDDLLDSAFNAACWYKREQAALRQRMARAGVVW